MKTFTLSLVAALAVAGSAQAAITVSQNGNIGAGMAAFGPSVTVLDWSAGGSPGTAAGSINIANWIDGPGFDNGINPANDLAINGVENVSWTFAAPVTRIGFAMATGMGRFPTEFDHLGASFNLITSNGDNALLTLTDPGNGYAAWIEITSDTPFTSLSFTETSPNIFDQYWGNVVSSAVPEPESWMLMIIGFGAMGAVLRQRKQAQGLPA